MMADELHGPTKMIALGTTPQAFENVSLAQPLQTATVVNRETVNAPVGLNETIANDSETNCVAGIAMASDETLEPTAMTVANTATKAGKTNSLGKLFQKMRSSDSFGRKDGGSGSDPTEETARKSKSTSNTGCNFNAFNLLFEWPTYFVFYSTQR